MKLAFNPFTGTFDFVGSPGGTTISGLGAAGQVAFWNGAAGLDGENNFFWDHPNNRLGIRQATPTAALEFGASTGAEGGINFGGDTNLYRQSADRLRTDDTFQIAVMQVGSNGSSTSPSIAFAQETGNGLYRPANNAASYQIANVSRLRIDTTGITVIGGAIINENGDDADFRVEGDTDINCLFLDASTDRVGIGTNTPNNKLDVNGTIQADGLRLDLTPTAETVTPTHTVTLSINGTNYKFPCVAA